MANLFAQDVLNVTDPIVRAARAALERDSASRAMKAPPVIEQYDPEVSREPISLPERNIFTDPESWLNRGLSNLSETSAIAILGEGTGNAGADVVLGFTGPGAAMGTMASGRRPGVLDVLPGGGILKGALTVSAPRALNILKKAGQRITADELSELTKDVAQSAVNRLAKSTSPISSADVLKVVSDEVDGLGDFSAKAVMKEEALKMVEHLMARNPVTGSMAVLAPSHMPFNKAGLGENAPYVRDVAKDRVANNKRYQAIRDHYDGLPPEAKAEIDRRADEVADQAVAEAERTGNLGRFKSLGQVRSVTKGQTWKKLAAASLREAEKAEKANAKIIGYETLQMDAETKESIRQVANDAYAKAKSEALASGMGEKEAKRVAQVASQRAAMEQELQLGLGDQMTASSAQRRKNADALLYKFAPDIQEEIEAVATAERDARKATLLSLGTPEDKAGRLARNAYSNRKRSEVANRVRELGFSSVSDPRLNDYKSFGRTIEESLLQD